jgi:hypothetical protein
MNAQHMGESEMETTQTIHEQVADQFTSAYEGFKRTYQTMNPPPEFIVADEFKLGWKQYGMMVGIVASVIVSGSHTIPIIVGVNNVNAITVLIGLSAFVMIEVMLIILAYSSTEQQFKAHDDIRSRVKNFTRAGFYFVLFVAVAANIIYVIEHNMVIPQERLLLIAWQGIRLIVYLAIGISAPVIAFITGEIIAVDVLEHRSRQNKLDKEWQTLMQEWQEALNRSWTSQRKKWGVDIQIDNRVKRLSSDNQNEYEELPETVSNSSKQLDYGQSLTQKAAVQYIGDNQNEYEELRKTVLDSNPTANKRDVAEAVAIAMTGDPRGYMTVIRAYKKLGLEL